MRPHGFPPALRVRRGADFDRAFREGGRAGDGLLVVHAVPNGGPEPRLGLAVGKVVGNAVRRNRVKRLLREAFRLHRAELPAAHDLVVVAKGDGGPAWTLAALAESLRNLSAKAAARRGKEPRRPREPEA